MEIKTPAPRALAAVKAGTPKQSGPSWAERSWGHLGGTSRVMVRDVRLHPITSGWQPLFSFAHSPGFKSRVSGRPDHGPLVDRAGQKVRVERQRFDGG